MGDKYIIELEEKPFHKDNGDFLYRVKGFNSLVFDMNGIQKLTPYTEPDLEQVRKEAYEKGYKAAKRECKDCPKQAYTDTLRMDVYQKGLSDAWEAVDKIFDMTCKLRERLFYRCDSVGVWDIIREYSASEVIEKIRQYEQEKEEIQVGDEVVGTYTGEEETEPFVIIRKIPEINPTYYFGIYSKSGEFCQGGLKLKKTGRHFPEIAEVLRKMGESE